MNTQSINRFLGACGATGPLRITAERPRVFGPVSVALEKPFGLIGSGVHADLRSRTGTHWNNGRQPFGWLDWGQSLWIGRHRVYLDEDESVKKSAADMPQ